MQPSLNTAATRFGVDIGHTTCATYEARDESQDRHRSFRECVLPLLENNDLRQRTQSKNRRRSEQLSIALGQIETPHTLYLLVKRFRDWIQMRGKETGADVNCDGDMPGRRCAFGHATLRGLASSAFRTRALLRSCIRTKAKLSYSLLGLKT